jgi:hypothetical protein
VQSTSIGSVEFGEVFRFAVSNRNSDGTALAFTPAFFDVIDNDDGSVVLANQTLHSITDRSLWHGSIDTRDTLTDQSGPFEPNRTYSIIIKESSAEDPATFAHYNFTVTGAYSQRLIRLLGLDGENLLVDKFVYDSGNNATSFRVRLFSSRAQAESATPGIGDESIPEAGEIFTYYVTQTFSSGRNLRQSHLSVISSDQGDQ